MPVTRSMTNVDDCGTPVASTSTAPAVPTAPRSNRNGTLGVDKSSKKGTATVIQPKVKSSKHIAGKRFIRPGVSVILEEEENEGDQMQLLETAHDFEILKQVTKFGKEFIDENSNIRKGIDSVTSGIASAQIARNELMKQYEAAVAKFKAQVQSNSVPTTSESKTPESTNRRSYSIIRNKRKQYFDDEGDEHSPSTKNTKQAHPEGVLTKSWTCPLPRMSVSFNFMDLNLTEVKAAEKSTLTTPSASDVFEITVLPQERAEKIPSNHDGQCSDPVKHLPNTPMSEINPTADPFTTPKTKGLINPVKSSGNGIVVCDGIMEDEVIRTTSTVPSIGKIRSSNQSISSPLSTTQILTPVRSKKSTFTTPDHDEDVVILEERINKSLQLSSSKSTQTRINLVRQKIHDSPDPANLKSATKPAKFTAELQPLYRAVENMLSQQHDENASANKSKKSKKSTTSSALKAPSLHSPTRTSSADSFKDAHSTFASATTSPAAKYYSFPVEEDIEVVGMRSKVLLEVVPPPPEFTEANEMVNPWRFSVVSNYNYDLTDYEEFVQEKAYRINKKMPRWARKDDNLKHELLLVGPTLYEEFISKVIPGKHTIFPENRPRILFPNAVIPEASIY